MSTCSASPVSKGMLAPPTWNTEYAGGLGITFAIITIVSHHPRGVLDKVMPRRDRGAAEVGRTARRTTIARTATAIWSIAVLILVLIVFAFPVNVTEAVRRCLAIGITSSPLQMMMLK
jgi:hypothetical protein